MLLIDRNHPKLSLQKQCLLLGISRSNIYYIPCVESSENLLYMRIIDEYFLKYPFYGVRRMQAYLQSIGHAVNVKRVRRLYQLMGLEAIYPKPNLSKIDVNHKKYPYLLRGVEINRVNQVWSTDITYIPMKNGFLYLTAVIDWYSRYVISWDISNTMDVSFCINVVKKALTFGMPEIFNSDQGSQYTSIEFSNILLKLGIKISMDGVGRALDNIFIERLWRSVKYEDVYLHCYDDGKALKTGIDAYFEFYNNERLHQNLNYSVPKKVFLGI